MIGEGVMRDVTITIDATMVIGTITRADVTMKADVTTKADATTRADATTTIVDKFVTLIFCLFRYLNMQRPFPGTSSPRIAWGGDRYVISDGKSTQYYIDLQKEKVLKAKNRMNIVLL